MQNSGYYGLKLGDVVVTALNDGQFEAPPGWVSGLDAAGLEQQLHQTFRPFPMRITLNAFLLESGGRKILVDTGAGGKFGPAMGRMAQNLRSVGTEPAEIDTILLTHAHTDHMGGMVDEAGKPVFPNAELVVNAAEHAFWTSETNAAAAPEDAKGGFKIAQDAFAAYAGRTRFVGDGDEVAPGVTARLLPGHTIGHTGYLVQSGSRSLLIWGDIVHLPGVQFDKPEVCMVFDYNKDEASKTRLGIFEEAVEKRWMIAGMHLDFPTFGFIRKHEGRFELLPNVWGPDV